jgi:hypothetical protein
VYLPSAAALSLLVQSTQYAKEEFKRRSFHVQGACNVGCSGNRRAAAVAVSLLE